MNPHHLPRSKSQDFHNKAPPVFHNHDNFNLNNSRPPNHSDYGPMSHSPGLLNPKKGGPLYPQAQDFQSHRTQNLYNEKVSLNSLVVPPPYLNQDHCRPPPNYPHQRFPRFPHPEFHPPNVHHYGRPSTSNSNPTRPPTFNVGSPSNFSYPAKVPSNSSQDFRSQPNLLQFTRPPPGYPQYGRTQNLQTAQENCSISENQVHAECSDDSLHSKLKQNCPQDNNLELSQSKTDEKYGTGLIYHPLDGSVLSFKKDQMFVAEFIQQKLNKNSKFVLKNDSASFPGNLKQVFDDVDSFRCSLNALKRGISSSMLHEKLEEVSSRISSPSYQSRVKKLVNERRKKRIRQRNAKKIRKEKILLKHKIIDEKLKTVIQSEQRIKKQKELKEEADFILKEVTSKQSECSNLLKVLSKVTELRDNRLKRGAQQGYVADEEKDSQFKNTIDSLHNLISVRMEEYSAKKLSLKAMIEEHQNCSLVTDTTEECKDITTEDISKIYFGSNSPLDLTLYQSFTAAKTSVEMQNRRRYLWNSYLSEDGSEVPVQWTLPRTEEGEWDRWRKGK